MEIPHLVRERIGDEPVEGTVALGDEDLVCVTPSRTLVYRSEGLLSDESVSVYPHDVERFDVSEGRRKTKFVFESVDGTESFAVPGDRTDTLLKLLLGGVLHVAGVTDDGESIGGVFSFSELTLVVTSDRLVKHVGEPVWDDDFEVYPYADVTGLSFEEGSVATQVVLAVDGRPERIKAPSDEARKVEQTLEQALFAYHDVSTLAELNERVGPRDAEPDPSEEIESSPGLSLDDGISPLVSDDSDDPQSTAGSDSSASPRADSGSRRGAGSGGSASGDRRSESDGRDGAPGTAASGPSTASVDAVSTEQQQGDDPSVDPADVQAIQEQLAALASAVEEQNRLIRDQQETVETLVQELRRGR